MRIGKSICRALIPLSMLAQGIVVADDSNKVQKPAQGSAAPSYPGPGVETWLGKRFPPPAPSQPALKSGSGK